MRLRVEVEDDLIIISTPKDGDFPAAMIPLPMNDVPELTEKLQVILRNHLRLMAAYDEGIPWGDGDF